MVEVMKIMVTSFKRSHAGTATLSAPSPEAGHHWPTSPPETTGCSPASLGQSLVGSRLLSPGSWLMTTSSKRAYAIPRSTAPRALAPAPVAVHCWRIPPQETLKHNSVSVLWDLWILVSTGLFEPSERFQQVWDLILNVILPLLPSCSGSWWWIGRPGMLQSMEFQTVGHDWATELTDWLTDWPSCWGFSFVFGCELSPHRHSPTAQLPLLITKFRLKLKKVGKTSKPFRYDLNQIPYDYTVEVTNRFKGLGLIDTVPGELWTEVHDIVQEAGIKTIPKKCQKAKWLSKEALQIAVNRREAKGKGEKER